MTKGTIAQNENYFIINEKSQGIDTLVIYDEKNRLIDTRLFRVRNVPNPVVCIGSYCGYSAISKKELLAQAGLIPVFQNFDFEIFFKITKFQMTFLNESREASTLESANNIFTIEMKQMIENLQPGTKIIFENINAVGPDGQLRRLEPISIYLK